MSSKKSIYIENAKLKGYKSIENASINFEPNLNIIIGKNAVGKTNFINFINNTLNFNFRNYNNFECDFLLKTDKNKYNFSFIKKSKLQILNQRETNDTLKIKRFIPDFSAKLLVEDKINSINAEFSVSDEDQLELFFEQLEYDNIYLKSTFIKHGLPSQYLIIQTPLNIELIDKTISDDFIEYYSSSESSNFTNRLLTSLITDDLATANFFNKKLKKVESINKFINNKKISYKNAVLNNLNFLNELKKVLNQYSPIENLRINENFVIEIDNEYERVNIKNFYLEYFIDSKWYTFDDLSDGTKRIFYIISEIFILDEEFSSNSRNILNVIFIEEPELGIHPYQLFNLMKYIKECSRYSQIIVTTHSPLSLDILEKDELKSIIIAGKVEGKTSLKKLNKEKLEKAKLYMDELNLSDFWINSDLED